MNVVDSSAWLEYFAAGPNAERFAAAIENTGELIVPAIVIFEVVRRVMQQRGEDAALQVVAILHQGRVVPLDGAIALSAAKIGTEIRLPLADSVILATARQYGATVWTMDADFEGLPDVRYFGKRGRSVMERGEKPFGSMRGTVVEHGDIVAPDHEVWSDVVDPLDRC